MPKKGHTEEQIVAGLQRVESGKKEGAVCRALGISEATYYVWKKQYASSRAFLHSFTLTKNHGRTPALAMSAQLLIGDSPTNPPKELNVAISQT